MDNEITKLYYSISEVAEIFDVSNSLLRFWESEFDILKPRKNRKGDRKYTQKDIDNIKLIYHLVKEKGFTLDGAKREIKENKDQLREKTKTIERLKEIRSFLESMKKEL